MKMQRLRPLINMGIQFLRQGVRQPDFLIRPITELASISYCMSGVSHQYFGHWLQDAYTPGP